MAERRDALLSAARIVAAVNRIGLAHLPGASATVGSLAVHPNSRNTIPGRVAFTVDLRHQDETRQAAMKDALETEAASICAADNLELNLREIANQPPLRFDPGCVAAVRGAAAAQGAVVAGDGIRRRPRCLPLGGALTDRHDLHPVRRRHQPQRAGKCHP